MAEWCMAHPWMTFFLTLAVIEAISNIFQSLGKIMVAWIQKNNKEDVGGQSE